MCTLLPPFPWKIPSPVFSDALLSSSSSADRNPSSTPGLSRRRSEHASRPGAFAFLARRDKGFEMSCNGCRVLRKGCSDACVLRSSLQWIESPEAQGHATVFVAKFFGRAGMLSFINAVAESQRPALFQSLLYEACGRTVNPVFGAVGLLWSGNWTICQAAVETVLKGGSLKPTAWTQYTESPHKPPGNPPLKRPHSLTDPDMSPNAEVKRVRSSNFRVEPPEFKADAPVAYANDTKLVCLPESDANTSRSSEILGSSDAPKQIESPRLVVPVARRVKPPTGYLLASKFLASEYQQALSREQERDSHRTIELGLSLNSQAFENVSRRMMERRAEGNESGIIQDDVERNVDHITFENNICHEEEPASCIEVGRSSSPCSFSINSEGSVVASVDMTDFSISGAQTFVTSRSRKDDYHLLHLL